jgi:hypothetical protein
LELEPTSMVGTDAEPASPEPAEDLVVPSARPKVRARPAKSAEDGEDG